MFRTRRASFALRLKREKPAQSTEVGIPFRDIASLIAARLKIPALGISAAKAGKHFGILANFVGADNPASSQRTRDALAWRPVGPSLLADMDAHYFQSAALAAAA